ncbi:hypothetical protein BKA69DRAFT_415173 [Paraphysoderma sedebokerense]|nr:hypothetical protein BKA69DRAFT_415173 [Paraphysoderma sedebokerense]
MKIHLSSQLIRGMTSRRRNSNPVVELVKGHIGFLISALQLHPQLIMQSSIKKRIYTASSKVTPVKATIYEPGMKNKSTVDLNLSKEKINYDVATESYPKESALPAAIRYANISSDSLDRHNNMQPTPRAPSITKVSKESQLSSSLSQSQEPSVAISASSVITKPNSGEPSSLTEKPAIASTTGPTREQPKFDYVEYDLPFERSMNGVRRERTMTNGSLNSMASTSTHTFHTDSSHVTSAIPTEPSNEDMCRQLKSLQHAEVQEKQEELKEELKGVKEIQRAVAKPCAIAVTAQPKPTIQAFTDENGRVHYFDFARAVSFHAKPIISILFAYN